jgi:hypothetical protein
MNNQVRPAVGRHYVFSIMSIIMAGIAASVAAFLGIQDTERAIAVVSAITVFAMQGVTALVLFAKQVETNHRINGIVHELMESEGLLRYIAGKKQGRADAESEQHARDMDKECD